MSKLVGFIADTAGFRLSIMVGAVPLIVVLMLIPPVYHNRPAS
jgi:hypothetical protein